MPNAPIGPNDPENQVDKLVEAANRLINELGLDQPHQIARLIEALQERLKKLEQPEQGEGH